VKAGFQKLRLSLSTSFQVWKKGLVKLREGWKRRRLAVRLVWLSVERLNNAYNSK